MINYPISKRKLLTATTLTLCFGAVNAGAQDYSAFVYEAGLTAPAAAKEEAPQDNIYEARGVLRAAQTAEIGASMSARLIKVPLKPGAQADLQVAKAKLKHCKVYAPYSGTLKTRYVSNYDTPPPGAPLFSIIRAMAPEIDLITPSSWMRKMKPGDRFAFEIDETGETLKGKIVRFGAAVDPVSQTIEVTAKFDGSSGSSLPGMSGVARFNFASADKS